MVGHKILQKLQGFWGRGAIPGPAGFALEPLEPRLLLSADPLGLSIGGALALDPHDGTQGLDDPSIPALIDALAPPAGNAGADRLEPLSPPPPLDLPSVSAWTTEPTPSAAGVDLIAPVPLGPDVSPWDAAGVDNGVRHELLFIDPRTPDYAQMLEDIRHADGGIRYEVVILDTEGDGIAQISAVLQGRQGIDAVHFISHGSAGGVQLGGTWLTQAGLAEDAAAIGGWALALTAEADLLFYGCDLAATPDGTALIDALSALTGADVAASTDVTGQARLGGDWDLEYRTGQVESRLAFSGDLQQQWSGSLAVAALNATQDTYIKFKAPDDVNNFGTVTQLIVDRETNDLQRALLKFDLSSIPVGATVNSATLKLQSTAIEGALNIDVYEVSEAWSEGAGNASADAANWNERTTGTNWTTAGGSYNTTAVATLSTSATGQHTWDISNLVKAWFLGTKTNNGIMVASPDGGGNRTVTYDSREGTIVPVLEIDYTPLVNAPPTGSVTISGSVTEDQTLTASHTLTDLNGMGAVSYQWQRDGLDIAGATGNTYLLGDADVGGQMTVVAKYTDGLGNPERVSSSATAAVVNVNDAPTGGVTISGTVTEDQTLTASHTLADADGLGAIGYQWRRDGVDIAGATAATYTLTDADVGAAISVVASYTDGQGTAEAVASGATAAVVNVNDVPTGITLSNAAVDERTDTSAGLTVGVLTTTDPDPADTATYTIQGGADAARFAIANGNELVLSDGVLDYETQASYTVIVRVTDSGGLSHDQTLLVAVNDLAEVPPPLSTVTATATTPSDPVSVNEAAAEEAPVANAKADEGTAEASADQTGAPAGVPPAAPTALPEGDDGDTVDALGTPNSLLESAPSKANSADSRDAATLHPKRSVVEVMKAIQIAPPGWDGILNSDSIDPMSMIRSVGFNRGLDELRDDVSQEIRYDRIVSSSFVAASTGLSIGYVAYLLRGGVLISSVLSSLPAWTLLDPTPILASTRRGDLGGADDDESLESMVETADTGEATDPRGGEHDRDA